MKFSEFVRRSGELLEKGIDEMYGLWWRKFYWEEVPGKQTEDILPKDLVHFLESLNSQDIKKLGCRVDGNEERRVTPGEIIISLQARCWKYLYPLIIETKHQTSYNPLEEFHRLDITISDVMGQIGDWNFPGDPLHGMTISYEKDRNARIGPLGKRILNLRR